MMFEKVDENTVICKFDGVNACGVYAGYLSNMQCITDRLDWRIDNTSGEKCLVPYHILTLEEIREQCEGNIDGLIIVVRESLLGGDILQYGNHGDYWEVVGELGGYA